MLEWNYQVPLGNFIRNNIAHYQIGKLALRKFLYVNQMLESTILTCYVKL